SELHLPTASGVDLIQQLKARHPVHGIAMSSSGDAADVARCLQAGFASFLVKPLDLDRLLAEIASAPDTRLIA
ncbi:MAG: response regulator, partial [bacterium]|nr:response regulator [Candidatus Kapabacteria bacterium]